MIMKELSIEEKVKAYDRALEIAKAWCKLDNNDLSNDDLETLFPELRESEDERVRKDLIGTIHLAYDCGVSLNKEQHDKAIAWLEKQGNANKEYWRGYREGKKEILDKYSELEKQGELSIKWNKNTEGNKPQVNHSVLMKTIHGIAEGEWKGEYWEQYRWAGVVRDSDVLSWIKLSDLEKQGEQKYDWGEEDEKEYKYVLKFVDNILNNCGNKKDYDHSKRCYDWLKSIKQKIKGE